MTTEYPAEDQLKAAFTAGRELALAGCADRTVRAEVLAELLRTTASNESRSPDLRMRGAVVRGRLDLDGAEVTSRVFLHDCDVPEGVSFVEAKAPALSFDGSSINELHLRSATISHRLSLRRAQLAASEQYALLADAVSVGESVRLDNASCRGLLSFISADIRAQLILTDAHLRASRPDGPAINAWGASIGADIIADGTVAEGELLFSYATAGGRMTFNGASLTCPTGTALCADGATIHRDVLLGRGFHATGDVAMIGCHAKQDIEVHQAFCGGTFNLRHTTVAGSVRAAGVELHNTADIALDLRGSTIAQELDIANSRITGGMDAAAAEIHQMLYLNEAELSEAGTGNYALNAHAVRVGKDFVLSSARIDGEVRLIEATTTQLDDEDTGWPHKVLLNGFTYTTLYPHLPAADRLRWLRRNDTKEIRTQPYEELARNYRHLGNDAAARSVLRAKERDITVRNTSRWRKPGRYLLDWLVGYGHLPGRAAWWFLTALIASTALFAFLPPAPVNTAHLAPFNALTYSLDLLLPTPALGVENHWQATGFTHPTSILLKLLGWILSIAVGASITRILIRK